MAGAVMESGLFSLYGGKQTAKGTPLALSACTKRFAWQSGDLGGERDDGSENWSSPGKRFRDGVDFINTITGGGEPVIPGHPGSVGQLAGWMLGADTPTQIGTTTVYKHVLTPAASNPWLTFAKVVGENQKFIRRYGDCKISSLQFETTKAAQLLKVTAGITSGIPELFEPDTATPAATALPSDRPFVWADMNGALQIDTGPHGSLVVRTNRLSFQVTMNESYNFAYGEAPQAQDVLPGDAEITFALSFLADADALDDLAELIYGTNAPSSGDNPTANIIYGELVATFTRRDPATGLAYGATSNNQRRLKIRIPAAKFTPTANVPVSPDGSPSEVAFAGVGRLETGVTNIIEIEVDTPDTTSYVA